MAAFRRAVFRLTLGVNQRFDVEGMSVVYWCDAPDPASLNARLGAALALLRDTQPRRFAAVRRGFRHILLIADGGQSFNLAIRCCVLDVKYIAAAPTVRLAAMLVHESVHARLLRWDIPQVGPFADRAEALAVREEIDFLESQPDTETMITALRQAAARKWWRPSELRARRRLQLAGAGLPAWCLRLHERLWP